MQVNRETDVPGRRDGPTAADLGEFGVIAGLISGRRYGPGVELGPGDDAAVLRAPDGRVVVTTDMLVEGRHFRLDWSAPHEIGRKAIAQNAADIEAMGATPTGYVAAVGVPADTPAALLTELADGMWEEADRTGAPLLGGDLVGSSHWVVSVTALGDLGGRAPVTRAGASAGSVVAVCGDLGRSAAGYALLRGGVAGFEDLRCRHLAPEPPYGQGAAAAASGAESMSDVSDGLLADLGHIAEASNVGFDLSTPALSADHGHLVGAAAVLGVDPWAWVLTGGEDHALVATFRSRIPAGWRAIGTVVSGPPRVTVDGRAWDGYQGWRSF